MYAITEPEIETAIADAEDTIAHDGWGDEDTLYIAREMLAALQARDPKLLTGMAFAQEL